MILEEGMIVEECPRCMTGGALEDEYGQMILCDKCDGHGYIDHQCNTLKGEEDASD